MQSVDLLSLSNTLVVEDEFTMDHKNVLDEMCELASKVNADELVIRDNNYDDAIEKYDNPSDKYYAILDIPKHGSAKVWNDDRMLSTFEITMPKMFNNVRQNNQVSLLKVNNGIPPPEDEPFESSDFYLRDHLSHLNFSCELMNGLILQSQVKSDPEVSPRVEQQPRSASVSQSETDYYYTPPLSPELKSENDYETEEDKEEDEEEEEESDEDEDADGSVANPPPPYDNGNWNVDAPRHLMMRPEWQTLNEHSYFNKNNPNLIAMACIGGLETPSDSEEEIDVEKLDDELAQNNQNQRLPSNPSSIDTQRYQRAIGTMVTRGRKPRSMQKRVTDDYEPAKRELRKRKAVYLDEEPENDEETVAAAAAPPPAATGKGRGRGRKKQHLSPSKTREEHNRLEKSRRGVMKGHLTNLQNLLVFKDLTRPPSKVVILRTAADTCDEVRNIEDARREMKSQQLSKSRSLRNKLDNLYDHFDI